MRGNTTLTLILLGYVLALIATNLLHVSCTVVIVTVLSRGSTLYIHVLFSLSAMFCHVLAYVSVRPYAIL